jgi:hypothetical protein
MEELGKLLSPVIEEPGVLRGVPMTAGLRTATDARPIVYCLLGRHSLGVVAASPNGTCAPYRVTWGLPSTPEAIP